jgi:hypothetical protein
MVQSDTYNGTIGSKVLTIPDHAFRKIIKVTRSGQVYEIITEGEPGNLQVLFTPSIGRYEFEQEINGMIGSDPSQLNLVPEKITIIWEG